MPINSTIELKLRIKRSWQQGEGKLLDYMMHHPTLSSTETVLAACRAYWMPLALMKAGEENTVVLREVGWSAILELEKQIQLIKRVLLLEDATLTSVSVNTVPQKEALSSLVPPKPTPTPEELDDELGVNDF